MPRARTSSKVFETPFGFASGWAEPVLNSPPPLVPSVLSASWGGGRPSGDDLGRPFGHRRVPPNVLDRALADEGRGGHQGDGQEHPHDRADDVDPEVAERRAMWLHVIANGPVVRKAAYHCQGDRNADGRGGELGNDETRRLREMAERRFAGVRLPVRTRDEAGGDVERE